MADPDVNQVARVICSGTIGTAEWANVFHFQYVNAAPLSSADASALATAFDTAWDLLYAGMSNSVLLKAVEVTDLDSHTGVKFTRTATGTGGVATAPAPANVAVCLSWKEDLRYRGGHPRTYLVGPQRDASNDTKTWNAGYAAGQQTNATNFLGSVNATAAAGGGDLVVVHYDYDSNHARIGVKSVNVITGVTVDSRVDSQRRRLGK